VIGAGAIIGLILAAMLAQTHRHVPLRREAARSADLRVSSSFSASPPRSRSAVPAIRAARVDPVVAFRSE
jgi:ketopantoate reductase